MNKQHFKILHKPAFRFTLIGVLSLLLLGWWIMKGEVTLIHYPTATMAPKGSCGDTSLTLHNSWAMITTVKCFRTKDASEEISMWYKNRGWSNFGERMIYPNFRLFQIRVERGKEFLVKEDTNNSDANLIVQIIVYRYTILPRP